MQRPSNVVLYGGMGLLVVLVAITRVGPFADDAENVIPSAPTTSDASDAISATEKPCQGKEIKVAYTFDGIAQSPFECQPYCADRTKEFRYILYADGYGTQCGVAECLDKGEDECAACAVPDATLTKYSLTKPTQPPSCART